MMNMVRMVRMIAKVWLLNVLAKTKNIMMKVLKKVLRKALGKVLGKVIVRMMGIMVMT